MNNKKKDLKKTNNYINKIKNNKTLIIIFLLPVTFLLLFLAFYDSIFPKIELKGKDVVILEYPKKYKEPGYGAKIFKKDLTKDVKVQGKVNYKKIGTYELIYSVKYLGLKDTKTRTVKVIDNENPEITLVGGENIEMCPNAKYKELGYNLKDNYDKELEDKLEIKETKDEILYILKDSYGNTIEKIRKLTYTDRAKPEIKLKGFSKTYLFLRNNYKEAGFIATDNCDGDLTGKVQTSGSINKNAVGTYSLKYSVTDSSGNTTSVTRTVVVQKPNQSNLSCGAGGTIYLTFDDGPGTGTEKVLNTLKEENVKATFFVTNSGPDHLIKRAYDEGHTIGLHTASHRYNELYSSVDNYFKDLNQVSQRVQRITGLTSNIIRFPGGSSNTVSRKYSPGIMTILSTEVINRGYRYYDWNVSSGDAGSCNNSKCVYDTTTKSLSKSKCNMVLMHDYKTFTADALKDIIRFGKENGYIFKKISASTPMVKQKINN